MLFTFDSVLFYDSCGKIHSFVRIAQPAAFISKATGPYSPSKLLSRSISYYNILQGPSSEWEQLYMLSSVSLVQLECGWHKRLGIVMKAPLL